MDDVVTINNNTTQGNPNPPPIRITPYFWRLTSCIAHFFFLITLIPCLVFMQKDTAAKEACSYLDAWAIAFTVRELLLVLAALMYVLYWDDTRLSGNQTYFIKKIIETQSGLYLATYFFMIFAFGSVTRSSPECKTTFSYKFSLAILVFQIIRMFSWFLGNSGTLPSWDQVLKTPHEPGIPHRCFGYPNETRVFRQKIDHAWLN